MDWSSNRYGSSGLNGPIFVFSTLLSGEDKMKQKKQLATLTLSQLTYHLRRLKNKKEKEDVWIMIEDVLSRSVRDKLRLAFYEATK